MFFQLNHQKLAVDEALKNFVQECYKLTNAFPSEGRFGMVTQIRGAALSAHLNIAEGASCNEIAKGSMIEIDTAPDVAQALGYIHNIDTEVLRNTVINCFKPLSVLIKASSNQSN